MAVELVLVYARGGHVSSPIGTNYLWRYRWYYQLFAREKISCPDKELYQVIIIIQHKIIILNRLHAQFVDAMSKCANSHEEMLLTRLAGGALSAKQGRLLDMEVFFKSLTSRCENGYFFSICGLGNIQSLMLLKRLRWIRVQLLMFTNGSVKRQTANNKRIVGL